MLCKRSSIKNDGQEVTYEEFKDFLGYYGHYLENIFGIGTVETLQQFYNSVKVAEEADFYVDWNQSSVTKS